MPKPRSFNPTKKELMALYPAMTMAAVAEYFGVGEATVFNRLKEFGIKSNHKQRQPRTAAHKAALSKAHKGKTRPKKGVWKSCEQCGKKFYVVRAREKTARFCSLPCRAAWMSKNLTGENSPNWNGGYTSETRICEVCEGEFGPGATEGAGIFNNRRFCSRDCGWIGQRYLRGAEKPNWKGENARRRRRRDTSKRWRNACLKRDDYTCQRCGTTEGGLHVHHIKPFETHPELRSEVSNGLTLCEPCHWKEHGFDVLTEGIQELIDERGVTHRRYVAPCPNCGERVVRQAWELRREDGSQKPHLFCSIKCSAQFKGRTESPYISDRTRGVMYETPMQCAEAYGQSHSASVYQKLKGQIKHSIIGNIRQVKPETYIRWARKNGGTLPYSQRART